MLERASLRKSRVSNFLLNPAKVRLSNSTDHVSRRSRPLWWTTDARRVDGPTSLLSSLATGQSEEADCPGGPTSVQWWLKHILRHQYRSQRDQHPQGLNPFRPAAQPALLVSWTRFQLCLKKLQSVVPIRPLLSLCVYLLDNFFFESVGSQF